jgi:hypothetical protein
MSGFVNLWKNVVVDCDGNEGCCVDVIEPCFTGSLLFK